MTNLALLERMPIFPLPDFVVFPGTPVPLHFFEPRYRALIEDVVAGDGMMVTVRLGPYTPAISLREPFTVIASSMAPSGPQ